MGTLGARTSLYSVLLWAYVLFERRIVSLHSGHEHDSPPACTLLISRTRKKSHLHFAEPGRSVLRDLFSDNGAFQIANVREKTADLVLPKRNPERAGRSSWGEKGERLSLASLINLKPLLFFFSFLSCWNETLHIHQQGTHTNIFLLLIY